MNVVGGDWGVRVKGRPESAKTVTNIYFYAGLEGFGELQLSTPFSSEVNPIARTFLM
jgi:Glycosyl hydrolase family 63 N-terminal domain